jgi:alkylation response protein AidB-like acyl-CoA dehydrogenase
VSSYNAQVELDDLRDWLKANWDPSLPLREWWARLAESGWGYPHFPVEWFGKGDPALTAPASWAIRDFGAVPAPIALGPTLAAPTLVEHGNDEQRARLLPGMLNGSDAYCQLFSEPNAGSDLASLQCRAVRDGDEFVVNGQKVWSSSAQIANKAMLLARTDAEVPKHPGLSYFIIDFDQPGIEVRPIREMTGRALFNEVFLTDVRVPAANLIGGEGNGWKVANTTLFNERSGGGAVGAAQPGLEAGPVAGNLDRLSGDCTEARLEDRTFPPPIRASELAAIAQARGRGDDPVLRQDLVRLHTRERVIDLTMQRARALAERGEQIAGLPQMAKMASSHLIRLSRQLTFEVLGPTGTLFGYSPDAVASLEELTGVEELGRLIETALFAAAPPIYGGSDQIQRNILGERVLGLAREPGDDKRIPFKDLPKN